MNSVEIANAVFEQVEMDRVADAVVEQIEQLIICGVLRPGQKLPPERELAEALGVSRPKLREAFQTLTARGLVEIRRSEGAFVQPLTGAALSPALIELFARNRSAFLDFLEFRREQESFAAHLAAQRATDADREILADLLAQMEAAQAAGERERESALDSAFHMAVIEAAHNTLIVHVMRAIYALMTRSTFYDRGFLYRAPGAKEALLAQHRAIVAAIEAGDPEAAAAASDRHHDFVERAYRASEDEDRRRAVAVKRRSMSRRPEAAPLRRRRR
ncbi:FCD domain-containing protein [Paralimibaculum aggregatum]|uniref:Pyruvate dehydrogenase complex repressor n=1 Tax=Paralimibaculum aggregatum TaxID=3036245 RepID=A0ABQ6LT59_9RHOB|nr:FadR/GntR family transcriptional regulator [Limibaculum sp. NKW23]GMG85283.1 FCD domain-containing protein [Limibaculum sp. NKW23]